MTDELILTPRPDGALVQFPPGRPWSFYRAFREYFPKARPAANWSWFVPGSTAARRVTRWQAERAGHAIAATRQARQEAADREWEAAAPPAGAARMATARLPASPRNLEPA